MENIEVEVDGGKSSKNKNEDEQDILISLYTQLNEITKKVEDFVKNNQNKEYLFEFRNIMIQKNMKNLNIAVELDLLMSIVHFLAISEINGVLFSLFEEIKRSFHYLRNKKYNTNKNFYDFFKN